MLGPVDLITSASQQEEAKKAVESAREEASQEDENESESEGFDASRGAFNTGPVNLDSNVYDPVTSGGSGVIENEGRVGPD